MPTNDMLTVESRDAAAKANSAVRRDSLEALWVGEEELLREFVRALRTIRFGSIVITLHDGRIVEIQKTERIRRNKSKENSPNGERTADYILGDDHKSSKTRA
jgi:hypothetical protein